MGFSPNPSPGGGASVYTHPEYVSGRHYPMYEGVIAASTPPSYTSMYISYVKLPRAVSISKLSAYVSTQVAGGKFQLGVYGFSNANGRATGLPLCTTQPGAGNGLSTTTAGVVSAATYVGGSAANAALPEDVVGMALQIDNAASTVRFNGIVATNISAWLLGSTDETKALSINGALVHVYTNTFGTWPDLTSVAPNTVEAVIRNPALGFTVA